ncbi:CocE/NonD family hydrolase [Streptomyces sp. NPDC005805]|uniref:CocE/NonD family hydrolase n=1 Tax=Streptomyces sp. NPDC005805 TaxID=3157068 RepID=UPI0033C078E1
MSPNGTAPPAAPATALPGPHPAPEALRVVTAPEALRVVTADGVPLATEVRLPAGPGPFPAVVLRTPYDRRNHRAEAAAWAARGFAAVVQDVRGRYGSGGDWHPYRDEAADSAATLRRVREQPWSDGRVVAVGASYAAHCALATATTGPGAGTPASDRPDAVIAAVPALGLAETGREPTGPERLYARAGWWAAHGDRPDADEHALARALAADPRLLEHLPLIDLPRRLGRDLPSWPRLWDTPRPAAVTGASAPPLLVVGGTHDPFADDALRLWRDWHGPARLLVGPWGHGLTADPAPGATAGHRLNLGELYVRWARAALRGTLGPGRRGAVALGGAGHWCPAEVRVHDRVWESGRPAGLRTLHGAEFTADPAAPVRSDTLDVPTGGTDGGPPAPAPDRTVLVTPPLDRPLDVVGTPYVRLRATASTPSADWAVRLVALDPDGRAGHLATGIVRRHDPPSAEARFRVPLGLTARRLPAGTRLRVEVAGHHFPAHARNPHTGADPVRATRLDPSRRAVRETGSALVLPVAARRSPADPVQETCT